MRSWGLGSLVVSLGGLWLVTRRMRWLIGLGGLCFGIFSESCQVSITFSYTIMTTPRGILNQSLDISRAMLDEQSPNYGGIYAGKTSDAPAREEVESSDLCLLFGRMDGDIK